MSQNTLYYKIYSDIKRRILAEELKPGDRLPRESELEKLYGASRAPVRQALAMLDNEAFLVRCQGRGTFVADRRAQSRWLFSSGFSEAMGHYFEDVYCRTFSIETESPDEDVRKTLSLERDGEIIHLRRVRYFRDIPVFSIHNYMRDTMNIDVFRRAGDFFIISDVLEKSFEIVPQRAVEELAATLADEETARVLEVEPGFPVLGIKRVYYDRNDRTIYLSRYHVRTDLWVHKTVYRAQV